jgi:AbiV family abortive infection protein
MPFMGDLVKKRGGSPELANMFEKLVDYFCKYRNNYAKHDDAVIEEEVEFIIDTTCAFLKLRPTRGQDCALKGSDKFLEIYRATPANADLLISNAEILFERKRFATAYFLAFTALEKIAKSQLAADVYTGFIPQEEFWSIATNHKKKISEIGWASAEGRRYLDSETETHPDIYPPEIRTRMSAICVQCNRPRVESPIEVIAHEMAKSLIHTVRSARRCLGFH